MADQPAKDAVAAAAKIVDGIGSKSALLPRLFRCWCTFGPMSREFGVNGRRRNLQTLRTRGTRYTQRLLNGTSFTIG
jgi:hypothetical protein